MPSDHVDHPFLAEPAPEFISGTWTHSLPTIADRHTNGKMDNSSLPNSSFDVPENLTTLLHFLAQQFHRLPGSAIFLRYVKSSYQNDPVRSALELFLVLFAIRYLLAPKYSTKPGKVALSDEVSACYKRIL